MPQALEPLKETLEPSPGRVRWTRRQCEAIQEAGIITGRYELIDGEILSKMGQKPPHGFALTLLMDRLVALFGTMHVRMQCTIDIGNVDPLYNEPEPDGVATAEPAAAYADCHPGPRDLLLVVEVSDSSLRFDRGTKAALYARAGIREYWIVDLNGRRLLVHRQPAGDTYREITAYGSDESAATLARPDAFVRVGDLLP